MTDKLDDIFKLQNELNCRIGVNAQEIFRDPEAMRTWVLNYSRALGQELAELVDSTPWKWWAKYQEMDLQNARVEIIDMLHFLVSLAQVTGMSADDVFELYTKKHKLNHERQDMGYVVKDHSDNEGL